MQVNYSPLQIVEYLRAMYAASASLVLEAYGYAVTIPALTAGTSTQVTLNVNGNADFLCLGLCHRSGVAGAAQTVSGKVAPLARLLVTDAASGKQWWSAATDIENVSENGPTPKSLWWPRMVQGKSSLVISVSSYEAANADTFDLLFCGVNVYGLSI